MTDKPTVTIAGTAGRKEDATALTKLLYAQMVEATQDLVTQIAPQGAILVSGGAAYADHIAILLFLRNPELYKLRLFLPAALEAKGFADSGDRDWKTNPGGTSNYYHRRFAEKTGHQSFQEMHQAVAQGAEVFVGKGFHDRNLLMAKSDMVIALTFGSREVKDGGTKHMTDNHLKYANPHLWHISLPTLDVHNLSPESPTPELGFC